MKPLFVSLCLLVLAHTAFGQDFKGIPWGVSIEDIRPEDGQELRMLREGVYVVDEPVLEGSYYFYTYGGLFLQGVLTLQPTVDASIDVYLEAKKQYSRLFGTPVRDEVVWLDEQYKNDRDQWNLAIVAEHLVYQADWQTDTSLIRLTLWADPFGFVTLSANFRSLDHLDLIATHDQESDPEGLLTGSKRYGQ